MSNLSNLQYSIVFLLARVSLPVFDRVASAFKTVTATMNSVAIAMFFDKICKAIFDHFFAAESSKGGFFRSLSIYFGILKTNNRGMFYFYCLVWLKDMTNFLNFRQRIYSNSNYFF